MTLPTNYADGNIIHGSDVDSWTTAINATTNAIPAGTISGETSTATAAGTTTLTISSPQFQKFTGTTTQICKLPTTSIVIGNWWLIINESTGTVTIEASGGGTLLALPGGNAAYCIANSATPTTAAGWDAIMLPTGGGVLPVTNGGTGVSSLSATPAASTITKWDANSNLSANNMIQGWTTTASTSSGTLTMTVASTQIQQITGSNNYTVKLPTTGVVAGMTFYIYNTQTSNTVAVQASGAGAIVTLAANTSGWFTANSATPTTAGGWDAYYDGLTVSSGKNPIIQNSLTFAGTDGDTFTFPNTSSDTVATIAASQNIANKNFTTGNTIAASDTLTNNGTISGGTVAAALDSPAQFAPALTTSAAGTLTLSSSDTTYVYTGSSTATWTLPAISGDTGTILNLYNRGSGNVTVQCAGSDDLYDGANGSVTSVTMAAGNSLQLYDDGSYWLVVVPSSGGGGGGGPSPLMGGTSSSTSVMLSASDEYFVYTGSAASTWTLPTVSGNTGAWMILSNRGAGTITLASNSGSQIYDAAALTTISITPGLSVTLVNDGTYWVVVDTSLTWDSTNLNLSVNNLFEGYTTTATAGTTTTLTVASDPVQVFTGTTTQTVKLPTTSIPQGAQYLVNNQSTGAVTVKSSGSNTIVILAAGTSAVFTAAVATPTTAANWGSQYGGVSNVSGKLLTVNNTMSFTSVDGASFNFGGTPTINTSAVGGITTTQTVAATYTIAANTLVAGQAFQVQAYGTQATTGTVTYYICLGNTGTNTDTVLASIALSNVSLFGANFQGMVTFRTTGSSGTAIAAGLLNTGTAATTCDTAVSGVTSTSTFDTTGTLYLTIQAKSAAGTHTVQQAFISVLQV